jgi:excisionase family DNA binding protein
MAPKADATLDQRRMGDISMTFLFCNDKVMFVFPISRHVLAGSAFRHISSHVLIQERIFFSAALMHLRATQPQPGRRQTMPVSIQQTKDNLTIMTVHDVAEYLRLSEAKVYRLVKERRIPVIRIGKTWRFRKDLLDDWLSECAGSSMKGEGK